MLKKRKRVLAILTALAMMVSLTCSSGYLILAEDMVATGQGLTDEELSEPRQPGPEKQEESESVHPGDQAAEGEGHEADEGSDSSPGDNGGGHDPEEEWDPQSGQTAGETNEGQQPEDDEMPLPEEQKAETEAEAQETNEGQDEISELVLKEQSITASGAFVVLHGQMPEGAYATAVPVPVEIEGQVVLAAYDITIYDSAGKEFQPQEGVITVEIVNTEVAQAVNSDEEISVYHMETAGAVPQEVAGVQPTASGVTFDAEGFSIYVVTMPETHFTVTYNFYAAWGAGEPLNTQILSQGEALQEPKSPENTANQVFLGWYDEEGNRFTDFGKTEEAVTENRVISLYAGYEYAYYVFYKDGSGENSKVLYTQKYGDKAAIVTSDVPFLVETGKELVGWSTEPNAEQPMTELVIDGADVTLYPVVKDAHWITYDSQGGSSVEPSYVEVGKVTEMPEEAPVRKGYEFDGWYTEAVCTASFTFGEPLSEDITLYAKWKPANTSYTVIFWKQQVTDSRNAGDEEKKYDYESSEIRTAYTGTTVNVQDADKKKDYVGFQYNAAKQLSAEVAADGSTVLNVYYDRKLITFRFMTQSGRSWSERESYSGLYGSTLAANVYTWPTDMSWSYNSNSGANTPNNTTRTMTYLDAFLIDQVVTDKNASEVYFFGNRQSSNVIIHYKESLTDNQYENGVQTYGPNRGFLLTNKFVGFTVSAWRMHKWGSWSQWKECTVNQETGSGWSKLEIRHKRNSYSLDYMNGSAGIVRTESVKYEQSLAQYGSYQPENRPDGVPAHFLFSGWYKDKECTERFDFTQTMPANNLVVYAKWAPQTVTVSFDTAGGTAIQEQTFDAGLPVTKPENPTREGGYIFAGWTRNGQPFNFATEIFEDTTLTAQWLSEARYTVSYHPNGAVDASGTPVSDNHTDSETYAGGAKAKLLPVPEGWNAPDQKDGFICWNTEEDGSGNDCYPGGTYTMPDADVVLYAKWAPCRKTTLTYDYNGGADAGGQVSETVPIDVPNDKYVIQKDGTGLIRDGYVFTGWSVSADGSAGLLQKGDRIQVDTLGAADANVLYAIWQKLITVTVSKRVEGNMGDTNRVFNFEYSVEPPESRKQQDSAQTGTLQLSHGQSATIPNVLPGSRITVTETSAAAEGYITKVMVGEASYNSNTHTVDNLTGDITFAFTNTKHVNPPTGLSDNAVPFAAMVLSALAAAVFFFAPRRRKF